MICRYICGNLSELRAVVNRNKNMVAEVLLVSANDSIQYIDYSISPVRHLAMFGSKCL